MKIHTDIPDTLGDVKTHGFRYTLDRQGKTITRTDRKGRVHTETFDDDKIMMDEWKYTRDRLRMEDGGSWSI